MTAHPTLPTDATLLSFPHHTSWRYIIGIKEAATACSFAQSSQNRTSVKSGACKRFSETSCALLSLPSTAGAKVKAEALNMQVIEKLTATYLSFGEC